MELADVVRLECIVVDAGVGDKPAALRLAAEAATRSPALAGIEAGEIMAGLEAREKLGSTGFGKGIAIPHCRLPAAGEFVVGLVTSKAGIDFAALDGKPVHLIVFIVGPEDGSNDHIRLLSGVSQALLTPGATEEIVSSPTPAAVRESFLRHTRSDIRRRKRGGVSMIHVFMQDEELFHDIIGQLTGTVSSSLLVLEAENAGAYLQRTPLFAGLLRDVPGGFCKVIVFTVDRRLTNETLRRIEAITGSLDARNDVLVTVQAINYSAGALSPTSRPPGG